jgi:hypothetical protein
MPNRDDQAIKRLKSMVNEEGLLKIITPFHTCQEGRPTDAAIVRDQQMAEEHPRIFGGLARKCEEYGRANRHRRAMAGGYASPAHYHLVDVKRIEPTDDDSGSLVAHGDDELHSTCTGQPVLLLARLTEHMRE